jgi:hypothetical protein
MSAISKPCSKCVHFNVMTQKCKVFNLPPWNARAEKNLCGKDGLLFAKRDCVSCVHLKNSQCYYFDSGYSLWNARSTNGYCGPEADFFLYKYGTGNDITTHHHIIDQ